MTGSDPGLVTEGVQMVEIPEVYTLQEVAERLRVSLQTVRRLVRTGELKTIKVGRQYRVTHAQLEAFMGQRQRDPEA
jgi:excisionase family DNA binding protein